MWFVVYCIVLPDSWELNFLNMEMIFVLILILWIEKMKCEKNFDFNQSEFLIGEMNNVGGQVLFIKTLSMGKHLNPLWLFIIKGWGYIGLHWCLYPITYQEKNEANCPFHKNGIRDTVIKILMRL